MNVFKQAGLEAVTYDERAFTVTLGSGVVHFLDNHYREYCAAWPWSRTSISERYARALLTHRPDESLDPAKTRENLRLVVRDASYILSLGALFPPAPGKPPASDFPSRPLAGHYIVTPVIDAGESLATVTEESLVEAGLTPEQAFAIGEANMIGIETSIRELVHGLWIIDDLDGYAASRLLLIPAMRSLAVRGRLTAIPVHRDELLLADDANPAALQRLAELANAHASDGRPIGLVPMVLGPDGWGPYEPPRDAAHRAIANLTVLGRAQAYENQKEVLDKMHEASGTDIFVASVTVMSAKDADEYSSYCTWVPGITALLPRADYIVVSDDSKPKDQQVRRYTWDTLMARCTHLAKPVGMTPERWLVTEPLTDDLLERVPQV